MWKTISLRLKLIDVDLWFGTILFSIYVYFVFKSEWFDSPLILWNLTIYHIVSCSDLSVALSLNIFSRYIILSLESESIKYCYISVAFIKEHAVNWINHVKEILSICLNYLTILQPKSLDDSSFLHILLHMIVSFTSTSSWCAIHSNNSLQGLKPGLERLTENLVAHLLSKNVFNTMQVFSQNVKFNCIYENNKIIFFQALLITGILGIKVVLKPVAMTAIMTICWRCLVLSNFSTSVFEIFIIKIYSIPLLVEHLISLSPKVSISVFYIYCYYLLCKQFLFNLFLFCNNSKS